MNIIAMDFKQREFDGKWERLAKIMDSENAYTYATETGAQISIVPEKWVTVGVTDLLSMSKEEEKEYV